MNAQFEWREEFNLGVEEIDKEHQRLFKIINKISAIRKEGKTANGLVRKVLNISKVML